MVKSSCKLNNILITQALWVRNNWTNIIYKLKFSIYTNRKALHLRRTRAATTIQKYFRCYYHRQRFLRFRKVIISIQVSQGNIYTGGSRSYLYRWVKVISIQVGKGHIYTGGSNTGESRSYLYRSVLILGCVFAGFPHYSHGWRKKKLLTCPLGPRKKNIDAIYHRSCVCTMWTRSKMLNVEIPGAFSAFVRCEHGLKMLNVDIPGGYSDYVTWSVIGHEQILIQSARIF